jgi:hypothetical protein
MFKKPLTSRMSACKLKPIALDFVSVQPHDHQDLFQTLRTPRHEAYKPTEHTPSHTQKQALAQKSATNRDRQASLKKLELILRENLLDLDLGFELESPAVCDAEKLTESHKFVIRKKRTPSLSSKGKDTSAGSSDNSLEAIQDSEERGKKVGDSPATKRTLSRGKSHTKNGMPCRIVNSKKLPFELHTRSQPKKRPNLEQVELDISMIERKEENESLVSLDSIQQICSLL